MDTSSTSPAQIRTEKHLNGALYGLIAGLAFALTAWGYDAFLLSEAHAAHPWLKLAIGAVPCALIGLVAGYLTSRLDSGLAGFLIWVITGLGLIWLASHVPYNGVSYVLGWLIPGLRGMDVYPFVVNLAQRTTVLYIFCTLLIGLGGGLEPTIVESSLGAYYRFLGWVTLAFCIPIFGAAGLICDELINLPLREPVLAVNSLIELARQAEHTQFSKEDIRQLHLRALDPLKDQIDKPYTLYAGDYDPESLNEVDVAVNFSGTWGRCWTISGAPTFCERSDNKYLGAFACLLAGGEAEACGLKVTDSARPQIADLIQKLGQDSQAEIEAHIGTTVLFRVKSPAGKQYHCFIRAIGDNWFDGCKPADSQVSAPAFAGAFALKATIPPTLQPTLPEQSIALPSATPTPANPDVTSSVPVAGQGAVTSAEQEAAVLPAVRASLPELAAAPRYTITLSIDFAGRSFEGHETLAYTNTTGQSLNEIYVRLLPNGHQSYGNGSLSLSQAAVNDQKVTPGLSVGNSAAQLKLPEPLPAGQSTRLDLDFRGQVPQEFGPGYGIYNLSKNVMSLANWYPILAVYDEKGWHLDPVSDLGDSVFSVTAFYRVDIQAASNLVIAATGVEVGRQEQQAMTVHEYVSGPARDFIISLSPDFKVTSKTVNGTTVNSYYLTGHEQGGGTAVSVASDAVRAFNLRFGPYPYKELDVVETPLRYALGVEYPGLIMIGSEGYAPLTQPNFTVTVAHEVAHQWWYNVVGDDVFNDPWLDEGMATFSSILYFEDVPGIVSGQGMLTYYQDRYNTYLKSNPDDRITQPLAHFDSTNNARAYSAIVYTKAALFFSALRQEIGDKAFFQGLRDYYQKEAFGIARPQDLQTAFEQAAGRSLQDFYQKWLYSPQ